MDRRRELLKEYILQSIRDGLLTRNNVSKAAILKIMYEDIGAVLASLGLSILGAKLRGLAESVSAAAGRRK